MYRAIPCSCGHHTCRDWHITEVAQIQGVHFTREAAEAVADFLNKWEAETGKKASR